MVDGQNIANCTLCRKIKSVHRMFKLLQKFEDKNDDHANVDHNEDVHVCQVVQTNETDCIHLSPVQRDRMPSPEF